MTLIRFIVIGMKDVQEYDLADGSRDMTLKQLAVNLKAAGSLPGNAKSARVYLAKSPQSKQWLREDSDAREALCEGSEAKVTAMLRNFNPLAPAEKVLVYISQERDNSTDIHLIMEVFQTASPRSSVGGSVDETAPLLKSMVIALALQSFMGGLTAHIVASTHLRKAFK